jgi:diguanylate cyclase (GGDEF)-like protein/PAS domain S-box-containing protein
MRSTQRQLLPYASCVVVVVALLPMESHPDVAEVTAAVILMLGVGLALAAGKRLGDGPWVALGGLLAFLVAVALLRDGVGPTAGFTPLVFFAVIWAALRRRRSELVLVIFGIALVFAVPLLVIGAPRYPPAGWRAGALTLAVAATLGPAVMALVERLHFLARRSTAILDSMTEGFALTRDGEIIAVNAALSSITGFSEAELVGARAPWPFWPPEKHRDNQALREQAIAAREGEFEATFMRADGTRFPVSISAAATDLGHGGLAFVNTVRDISGRRGQEDAQRRQTERLVAIADVTRAVGHGDPLDARRTIAHTAVAVSEGAHAVRIWEAQPDGGLITTATQPEIPVPQHIAAGAVEHGAHVAMRTGMPLFVPDAATSPHTDKQIVARVGTVSCHFHPIADASGVRGVLALSWPHARAVLSADDLLIIGVLADEAAIAMQRADLLARLDELTRTDELTGLPNRRAWDEGLAHQLVTARRQRVPLSIAMLDLDFFKRYNDEHGHMAGDRLLCHAAATWQEHLRASDVLARWGGEEFALLLPACDGAGAAAIVERLRGTLLDGVTFSAGITTAGIDTQPQVLLDAADQALYTSKANGRDHITVA